jgi:hypothetical protein
MTQDLNQWIPRLLKLWRKQCGRKFVPGRSALPLDRLLPSEQTAVVQGMLKLSEGLTRQRKLAGEHYFSDPSMLGAYLLYFWPISYLQARYALKDTQTPPAMVLDLGSGGGPLGAACYDMGARHVTFADRSRVAVKLAGDLARLADREPAVCLWDPQQNTGIPEGRFDLIGLEHVLNELWPADPERILRRVSMLRKIFTSLNPGGNMLLIEPALTPTSRDLLQIRNHLVQQGYGLVGPCLANQPCPALEKPSDSCHSEYEWSLPPLVQDLVKLARFQKKTLKMTNLLFGYSLRSEQQGKPQIFRIVSDPLVSKNKRLRLLGCGRNGRLSLALKPTLVSRDNRPFLSLKRGDLIRVTSAVPREGGLDLTEDTKVEVILRAEKHN